MNNTINSCFNNIKAIYGSQKKFSKGSVKIFPLIRMFFIILSKFSSKLPKEKKQKKSVSIIEFIFSLNQLNCSNQLNLPNSNRVLIGLQSADVNKDSIDTFVSNYELLLLILKYPQFISSHLDECLNDEYLINNWVRFIKTCALKIWLIEISYDTKSIINYNDHVAYNILIFNHFSELKKQTIYCQHAPVSNKFPKLFHDLNLLYSNQSLRIYKEKGICQNIKHLIIGDLRFWNFDFNEFNINNRVLICYNTLDCLNSVLGLANYLVDNGFVVVIRKHPAEKLELKNNGKFLISKEPSIIKDLEYSSAVITNESAVPLESIFMNKLTYLFKFSPRAGVEEIYDNYGFISSGLIKKKYTKKENLLKDLKENKILFDTNQLKDYIGPAHRNQEIKTRLIKILKL